MEERCGEEKFPTSSQGDVKEHEYFVTTYKGDKDGLGHPLVVVHDRQRGTGKIFCKRNTPQNVWCFLHLTFLGAL